MSENNFSQFLSKKAYEISYALFRMAAVVRRPSFADQMESRGLSLLDATVAEDYDRALILAKGIEYFLRFGADVGVLNIANVEVVARELIMFNSAIAEFKKSANVLPIAELGNVFSKLSLPVVKKGGQPDVSRENKQTKPPSIGEVEGAISREDLADNSSSDGSRGIVKSVPHSLIRQSIPAMMVGHSNDYGGRGNGSVHNTKSEGRQSAILERIRRIGNLPDGKTGCRLKEIQEFLPETSERTLRYDVQNLIEQGLIERIGNSGPATYYRAKTENTAVTFEGEQTL
jgi:hypothetical protein